jgi:hypothetical protein
MKGVFMVTYCEFIENILSTRGRNGCGEEYSEEHHITPRCMGGLNDRDNLIDLFAEEHFIAHKLLAFENPDNDELQRAFSAMAHVRREGRKYNVSEEDYAYIRLQNSQRLKQQWNDSEYRENMSNMMTELWKNSEFKEKATASWKNEERRKNQSELMRKLNNAPDIIEKKTNALHKWCDKAVQQLDDNGNVIAEFPSATEASRQTGIQQSCISRCCNRLQKVAGGYRWQFATNF